MNRNVVKGECAMCDYSLSLLASRPAKSGDRLVLTKFAGTATRGFIEVGKPHVAVCLQPGTQIAFEDDVIYERRFFFLRTKRISARVASFTKILAHIHGTHHDALEFPDGFTVLVTHLCEGQLATVLQLPPDGRTKGQRWPITRDATTLA
jgi:hypothetical protein